MPLADQGGLLQVSTPIVFYTDEISTVPAVVDDATWGLVVETLSDPAYREESPCTVAEGPKKCVGADCPHKSHSSIADNPMAWSPVEISGNRLDVNVRSLSLLVLDFDHLDEAAAARVSASLASYEHVKHTTHNHRAGDIAFRVVVLLSKKVAASAWHRFRRAAVAFLNTTVENRRGEQQPDPTCKNRSRLYYRPSHPKDGPSDAQHVRGIPLDVDAVLAWALQNVPEPLVGEHAPLPEVAEWDLAGEAVTSAIDVMARYFPPKHRNDICLAIAGMLRRAGATRDDARYIVREICVQGGSDNPDARAKTVDHTYGLADDGWMTGLTRVAEILDEEGLEGESIGKEFGDLLIDARNEAFLRGMSPLSPSQPSVEVGAVAPPVDLQELVRAIGRRASDLCKAPSTRDDKINAILLRRARGGQAIATPDGTEDVETVRDGATTGVPAEEAVRYVAGALAFIYPESTPWEAVALVVGASLAVMREQSGKDWSEFMERAYRRAQATRKVRTAERSVEEGVRKERVREVALVESGSPSTAPALPPNGSNWEDDLKKNADGSRHQIPYNAYIVLRNHSDFCGHLRWNEVAKRVEVNGGPMKQFSSQGIEAIVTGVEDHLASTHDLVIPHASIARRVVMVARSRPYDPLKDYLNSVRWDEQPRINNWLSTYCGAKKESAEYIEKVGRRWMLALVARGLTPGCKVDNVLVLEAKPGTGKSSVFDILGGEWFCDTAIDIGDKDSRMMAGQYWICEMAECVSFKKTGYDQLKNFFSSRIDKFRPPYGAALEESPRRCVWVGSTNDESWLTDPTGNRKYWPVACEYTAGATEALRRDRDQLLAEAVVAFRAGEPWHFGYEEIPLTEIETEKRIVETPAGMLVRSWWYGLMKNQRPKSVTTLEVAKEIFPDRVLRDGPDGDLMKIGHALKRMGFVKSRETTGAREWRHFATDELLDAERSEKRGHLFSVPGGKIEKK